MTTSLNNPVLVERDRGGDLEAQHRGAYCVVRRGEIVASAGQTDHTYFMRSAAKFFQAMPMLLDGADRKFGLGPRGIALMCASHGGEPIHVDLAREMLELGDFSADDLVCGAHPPMHVPSSLDLRIGGEEPGRLHNNCSGKHAGMLLGCRFRGESTADYCDREHPHQLRIAAVLSAYAMIEPAELHVHVDGCGAPTFAMSLEASARAYSRFVDPPADFAGEMKSASSSILDAVAAEPLMLAGHDRFDSALVDVTGGRVVAKMGADGFYGAMCREEGYGIALHIDDGSLPASERVLAALLENLGVIGESEKKQLHRYIRPMRLNYSGDEVGSVRIILP